MLDANDQLYDSENSVAACPTAWDGDNKPAITTPTANNELVWTLATANNGTKSIYGFQVRRCCCWQGGGGRWLCGLWF